MVVICEGAILEGPVTFASKSSQSQTPQAHSVEWIEDDEMPTIVHPKAQIRSIGAGGGGGAIVMGVGCIVMEHAQIINE